jgi:[ribosomal protein S18]-alanine N-acetyltransferase
MTVGDEDWQVSRFDPATDTDVVVAIESVAFSSPDGRGAFARHMERPELAHAYVVRRAERQVVGYCSGWIIVDELHINAVAVSPQWRRRGAASAMLRHVLRDAARCGVSRATLEVRASNDAALRLYSRFGFEVGGRRPEYYANPPEDALVLWCEQVEGIA